MSLRSDTTITRSRHVVVACDVGQYTQELEASMTISRLRNNGWFALIGALAYWLPDILIHQFDFSSRIGILLLTFAVPTVVLAAYFFARPQFPQHLYALLRFTLLGIWAAGPLGIAVGMVPHGGMFLEGDNLPKFFMLWAYSPSRLGRCPHTARVSAGLL